MHDLIEKFSMMDYDADWFPHSHPPHPPPSPISSLHPMHGVSFKISYLLTSFYYEVLYISSILVGGHTGVVTFLI